MPIFPGERSTDLFARIIKIFSPPNGSVIDPFGGPLTTALACLETSRKCTSMDAMSEAMRIARSRLRIFATPKASMADVDVYTDPPSSEQIEGDGPAPSHTTTTPRNGKRTPQRSGQGHSSKKPRVVVSEQILNLNGEDVTDYIDDETEYIIGDGREGGASQDEPSDGNALAPTLLAPTLNGRTNGESVDEDALRASNSFSVDDIEMDSANTLLSLRPRRRCVKSVKRT